MLVCTFIQYLDYFSTEPFFVVLRRCRPFRSWFDACRQIYGLEEGNWQNLRIVRLSMFVCRTFVVHTDLVKCVDEKYLG
jgi:hypothetical protein